MILTCEILWWRLRRFTLPTRPNLTRQVEHLKYQHIPHSIRYIPRFYSRKSSWKMMLGRHSFPFGMMVTFQGKLAVQLLLNLVADGWNFHHFHGKFTLSSGATHVNVTEMIPSYTPRFSGIGLEILPEQKATCYTRTVSRFCCAVLFSGEEWQQNHVGRALFLLCRSFNPRRG